MKKKLLTRIGHILLYNFLPHDVMQYIDLFSIWFTCIDVVNVRN